MLVKMIANTSAVILLALFWVFLYLLKEYVKSNFATKDNEQIMKHAELIVLLPGFISMILFAVLLMQDGNTTLQNQLLLVWIEFAILFVGPFIYIIIVAFVKSILEYFRKKKEVIEHE
jgi:hypothetical protein